MKRPWEKFYYSDWRADPALGMCSLAARGLWLEMLALMHEAEPRGHLLINGNPPDETQLAALARCPSNQVPVLLAELEKAGVFNRRRDRVIYSRRQVRDEKKRKDGEKAAKSGTIPGSRRDRQHVDEQEEKLPPPRVDAWVEDQTPSHLEARGQNLDKKPPNPLEGEFDDFWQEYPRREDKASAKRAFKAARKKTSADQLIAAAKAYAVEKKDTERQFIKLPATWLNAESWANTPNAKPLDRQYSDDMWEHYLTGWAQGKPWPSTLRGPAPNAAGCLVPERLLARYRAKFGNLEANHLREHAA